MRPVARNLVISTASSLLLFGCGDSVESGVATSRATEVGNGVEVSTPTSSSLAMTNATEPTVPDQCPPGVVQTSIFDYESSIRAYETTEAAATAFFASSDFRDLQLDGRAPLRASLVHNDITYLAYGAQEIEFVLWVQGGPRGYSVVSVDRCGA